MRKQGLSLKELYKKLLEAYGVQNWWPVDREYHAQRDTDERDEVIIGATLTQNTSWKNVERALENIKRYGELSLEFVRKVPEDELKHLIKPAGFYNQKAQRLKEIAYFINPTDRINSLSRAELLKVKGIGKETADVILLYAGHRLTFVVDKYTLRFLDRFYKFKAGYEEAKGFFEENLPKDLEVYKEFHALIDEHAKRFCKSTPLCEGCPVNGYCLSANPSF